MSNNLSSGIPSLGIKPISVSEIQELQERARRIFNAHPEVPSASFGTSTGVVAVFDRETIDLPWEEEGGC